MSTAAPASGTVLFHVSDLHFGLEDRAALDWFAAEVARHRPSAVLCTGDLTMRGTAHEFAAATDYLAALAVPITVEPGNHDMPYYYRPLARLLHPFRHYDALEAAVEGGLDLPDIAVVPLNTVARAQFRFNWSKGRVAQAGLDAALAGLAAHAGAGLRLVTCHHPLVEADTLGTASTRGGKRALAALARAGADAVLSGHVHDAFDRRVDVEGGAIRIIGAGTLSQRLRATPPSYNRLEWSAGKGLRAGVQSIDG
jgi:3',5'-cyclic AMP phosphodiesterase CpdA